MSWNAILAPAGTAPNILLNLHQALVKVLNQEQVRQQFQAQYFAIVGSTPTELKALMRLERKAAEQLIDELKLSLE
jgi:tripartite-type tricarboxylate transporter receptor subunit TctC